MKRLISATLVTLLLGMPATSEVEEAADGFQWTIRPAGAAKSYEFDIEHAKWRATLVRGDGLQSAEGHLTEAEAQQFYKDLEGTGVWQLQSNVESAGPRCQFLVEHRRSQHEAEFGTKAGADYAPLLKFVDASIVGHEEQALLNPEAPASPAP